MKKQTDGLGTSALVPDDGFEKAAILRSCKYAAYRDLLTVLLDPGRLYSDDDIKKVINDYKKTEVK